MSKLERARAPRRSVRWVWAALVAVPHVLFAASIPSSDNGPATGLADSAALRSTVFGTPPQDIAPMPERVPLQEIDISMPWARPVPKVLWFDGRLRVWFSAQEKPAPL